jgi:hypothetical protein
MAIIFTYVRKTKLVWSDQSPFFNPDMIRLDGGNFNVLSDFNLFVKGCSKLVYRRRALPPFFGLCRYRRVNRSIEAAVGLA